MIVFLQRVHLDFITNDYVSGKDILTVIYLLQDTSN